jgi:hypothetical protein
MKRLVLIFLLMASPAAADCGIYTSEARPKGEVTAKISDRELTITDKYDGVREYVLVSAGTGIPYQQAEPVSGDEAPFGVRMHKGDLIIDMIAYVPFCE